ncbi:MAG TPA: PQQ-binding-like beta-propeller repeat protein, partial [Bryobacteraceae bacterium]|nr:PQQ-binding-like beta-propeller repeat protein [Bryobacteraceae bacterium]
ASVGAAICILAAVVGTSSAQKQSATTVSAVNGEWRAYGGDKGFQRYSPLDQIRPGNVKGLRVIWARPSIDPEYREVFPDLVPSNYLRSTPIMINGVLYASNGVGLVEAFDAATGKTKWVQKPFPKSLKEAAGQSLRGVEYWRSGTQERIISIRGEYLYSLDAKTGEPDSSFGESGKVWLSRRTIQNATFFATNGPLVADDVIIVGGNGGAKVGSGYGDSGIQKEAAPDDIRGYDAHTGKLLWTFHVMPREGEPGIDTWGKDSWRYVGNMGNWGPMTADEKLGYVYVPLTAPTVSYYGGHRPGNNLYSDSLVALNARTGKLVWYFQTVHHDLWDYDLASPPILGDITVNGRPIKAVMQASKTGFLFVFDRESGKPVWPIEERAVPQSKVAGEETSPTQPFPTKPAPFDRQGITEDDLIDFTPALHQEALKVARQFVLGPIFTPPSLMSNEPGGTKGTLILPGVWGSGNWNTGAFDPEAARYYAVSRTNPTVYGLVKADDPEATIDFQLGGEPRRYDGEEEVPQPGDRPNPRRNNLLPTPPKGPSGLPLVKPPYGRITAYDMNKGEKLWTVANGDGPRYHPLLKNLNLPPLGESGRPAPLLTKTFLFLGESSDAISGRDGMPGPRKFRAYDKMSGEVVWEKELPAGTTGAPITYLANGRQYIVVPIGGKTYGAGWVALAVAPESKDIVLTTSASTPQDIPAARPPFFTEAQAQRGAKIFEEKCDNCHAEHAWGPELRGSGFWSGWDQKSARTLYSKIIGTMPQGKPGTLDEKSVLDLVAYILQLNGVPANNREIQTANQLNDVKLARSR